MTEPARHSRNNADLILLTALLAAAIVITELWLATTSHDNSRDQHLSGAVAFARGHMDIMRPMILGFNANGAATPLELPVWQISAAALMKCFGIWYGWGNVAAMVFYFSSLWALFDLVRRVDSIRTAWWALLFSLAEPISLLCGGQAGGDSTAWAFAMWFVYFAQRMMAEEKWLWWFFASVIGCVSAAIKAPFFMAAGLTTFFWLCLRHRNSVRAWAFLASSGIIGALFLLAWNYHCHKVYKEAVFPVENLDTLNGGIFQWYLASMSFRLNPHNWMRYGWHINNMIFGGFGLVFLLIISVRFKQSILGWLWMFAAFLTSIVFPNLFFNHFHYLFIYAPPVAWLCAIAAAEIEPAVWDRLRANAGLRTAVLFAALIATLTGFMPLVRNNLLDPYKEQIGQLIREHTSPDEKMIVWGELWGAPFLRANRDGLTGGATLADNTWFNDPKTVERLKQLGYKKIVLLNPSPFIAALTSVNGGDAREIVNLTNCLPTIAKNWPVTFENQEVLIVQIPDRQL